MWRVVVAVLLMCSSANAIEVTVDGVTVTIEPSTPPAYNDTWFKERRAEYETAIAQAKAKNAERRAASRLEPDSTTPNAAVIYPLGSPEWYASMRNGAWKR